MGVDVGERTPGHRLDSRIGYSFIYPGAGATAVRAFPGDVKARWSGWRTNRISTPVLNAVEARNEAQKYVLSGKIPANVLVCHDANGIGIWIIRVSFVS